LSPQGFLQRFSQKIDYAFKYISDLVPKSNQYEINKIARIVTRFKVNLIMALLLLGRSRQATLEDLLFYTVSSCCVNDAFIFLIDSP